jgi:quercetin 2,3-dioxygenase
LTKETYNGGILERKVLGFPHEKSPVKPYSNIFYWSNLISDYGCVISEHPHIGFEIMTYVLKGGYETYHKAQNEWITLQEGDMAIVQAGKGVRHAEKILPRSEVLQIWLDPDFDQYRKNDPELTYMSAEAFPVQMLENRNVRKLGGQGAPLGLNSKDVAIELHEFQAGFHSITCPEDTVVSGYVLDGYIEVNEAMLGKNDFFKVDGHKEVKIASLVNSKVFISVTPYQPEYQTYAAFSL